MTITYQIEKRGEGWAYRTGSGWSETFSGLRRAIRAATATAQRLTPDGQDAEILYREEDGSWNTEFVRKPDRIQLEHVHFNRGHIRLLRSSLHIPAV
jgi:hypothetical protein